MSREQIAAVFSRFAFVAGLALVVSGAVADGHPRLSDIGAGVAIGTLPVVILARVRHRARTARDAAESLRREGYRLGLEHAARGLLIPPTSHDDGAGVPSTEAATVQRLYLAEPKGMQRSA